MNPRDVLHTLRQLAPQALALLGAMAAVAAYLQALDYPFIADDLGFIATNSKLSALHLTELWRLFTEPYNEWSEFLPLRELSYWLDLTLFGLNPAAFRWHNIVLYLLCLPLIYGMTLKLWRFFHSADAVASASWAAAIVTALFALHPAHVEAVVWIAGRKDVLSGLFSLLALWLALRVKRERGFSAPYVAAALLALLAAMLSKATAVAIAPVIALLWVMFWRDIPVPDKRRSLLLWPLASLLLAASIALIFSALIPSRIPPYFGIEAVTRSLAVLGWLARLAVSPESRHYIYPVFEDPWLHVMALLGAAVLIALGMMSSRTFSLRSRHSLPFQYSLEGVALALFLLLCLPNIHLIPYALPSLVSDRFVFLAVWPAMLLLVALAWHLKPLLRIAVLSVTIFSYGYQTAERPHDWHSFSAIIDADWRVYPGNYILAMYKIFSVSQPDFYRHAFETASNITAPEFRDDMIRLVEADYAVHVGSALTGKPQEAVALLWRVGLDLGQLPAQAKWNSPIHNLWGKKEALLEFEWESLVKRFPDNASVRYSAGIWKEVRQSGHAVEQSHVATESQHRRELSQGTLFYTLGHALVGAGQLAAAEALLLAALRQSPPDLRAHCLLSVVYEQTRRNGEALHAQENCPDRMP